MCYSCVKVYLQRNMSDVYRPILTWGRCSPTWGHGRRGRGCSPPPSDNTLTGQRSEARTSPLPLLPVRGLP